jgi:response regulator RpfG family c-di-GMP phosphodiesterase
MNYKIMVVDDEPANLRLLERLFRRDYQVLTAASGKEALQLLEQHDVALLITDQRMPGMTGIELLKRTAEFRPHMVRMVLTGYTDIGALVEAINCGQVYKYVTKPWNNDDLRITVGRAVAHFETNKSRHELELANRRLSVRLQEMTRAVVRSISDALEAKDEHVYGHARRVSGYAVATGRRMRPQSSTMSARSARPTRSCSNQRRSPKRSALSCRRTPSAARVCSPVCRRWKTLPQSSDIITNIGTAPATPKVSRAR